MSVIKNLDDIKDISIIMVNRMIDEGIIEDCTDTDNYIEFDIQDIIVDVLCEKLNINNC